MSTAPITSSHEGDIIWGLVGLSPPEGRVPQSDYLSLTEATNQLIELADGRLEFPPMPTKSHQKIARFFCNQLLDFMEPHRLGDAVTAPYRVRLPDGTFREPDVVAYLQEHLHQFGERFGEGADLVVEVVSDGKESRTRDLDVKPREYSAAGISEYWIIDPQEEQILVLELQGDAYREHGPFRLDDDANSVLIPGFQLSVRDVFAAGGTG